MGGRYWKGDKQVKQVLWMDVVEDRDDQVGVGVREGVEL